MKQKIILLIIICLNVFLLFGQDSTKLDIEKSIIGKWYSMSRNDTISEFEFLENGKVKEKYYIIPFDTGDGYFSDYYKKWIDYELYKIEKENDQLFLNVYSPDKDLLEKNMLFYSENKLVSVNTKWWIKDISLHIDEILVLERSLNLSGVNNNEFKTEIAKYYLPSKLHGLFYIVYDQKFGEEKQHDDNGSRLYKIPSSGILFTQFKAAPLTVGLNKQEFILIDSSNSLNKIENISYHDKADTSLVKALNYCDEQLVVISHGFNQLSRNSLNELLDKVIEGNVEFLEILTFKEIKNRIETKGYL